MDQIQTEPIDQNNNQNDEKKKRDFKLRPKVFKLQDSVISQTLETRDVRSAYHIILSFVVYLMIANSIYLYTHPDQFFKELHFIIHCWDHFEIFVLQEVIYFAILFLIIRPTAKLWIDLRTKFSSKQVYLDLGFALIVFTIIGSFYYASLQTILIFDINPVMSIAIISEKLRMTMKTHAFIIESKRKQEIAIEKGNKDAHFMSWRQLLYYMFAPTLVCRDEYPRLEKRDYKLIAKLLLQWSICIYIMMIITQRIFIPTFSQIGTGPIDGKTFIKDLCIIFAASGAICLVVFYSFLHLYTNIMSQIFKFGDRIFYEDWWTCTDYSTYYRKWNILVHDWIYAYLYTPLVHLFNGRKVLAGVVSIYISAFFHEYIIAVALRQINPILTLLFAGFGVIFFVINGLSNIAFSRKVKKLSKEGNDQVKPRRKNYQIGTVSYAIYNTLFLLGCFNGWFVMITIYAIGYYGRKNCFNNDGLFTKYSWNCLNLKF